MGLEAPQNAPYMHSTAPVGDPRGEESGPVGVLDIFPNAAWQMILGMLRLRTSWLGTLLSKGAY